MNWTADDIMWICAAIVAALIVLYALVSWFEEQK